MTAVSDSWSLSLSKITMEASPKKVKAAQKKTKILSILHFHVPGDFRSTLCNLLKIRDILEAYT